MDFKMCAKLLGLLQILQEKGNKLREPYSKCLGDGIFEIRCKVGTDLTNGFVKKHSGHRLVKSGWQRDEGRIIWKGQADYENIK